MERVHFRLRTILLAVCLTVLSPPFAIAQEYKSDNWFPVYIDGKAGYIDRTGKIVLEPKYDGASFFSEGLARVSFGRDTIITQGFSQGFIDETGKVVIQPQWDVVSHFSEGLAAVGFDQTKQKIEIKGRVLGYTSASHTWYRWGFIDKTGKTVIEAIFSDISEFRDGIAAANTDPYEPKYGFIDKVGKWIIQPQFENTNQFSEGLARIFVRGKYGYIDKTGKIVLKPKYSAARDFSEGLACVKLGGDVIKPTGMSITRNNGEYAFIDQTGKIHFKVGRDGCESFSEGFARFEVDGKYGFVDKTGRIVIDPKVDAFSDFSNSLAYKIFEDGKFGYIDRVGTIAIRPSFGKASDFYRGLAEVCESFDFNAKCGYIDTTGELVWPLTK